MDMSKNPDPETETAVADDATAAQDAATEARLAKWLWIAVVAVVGAWITAGIQFGAVGLALPAVAAVPFCFIMLLLISRQ